MVMFQHAARNTAPAEHLAVKSMLRLAFSERAAPREYRKSQVHPTVYLRLFQNILNASNTNLASNEALVLQMGGTQEAVPAALCLGFKHVPRLVRDRCVWVRCRLSSQPPGASPIQTATKDPRAATAPRNSS